jgi:hypothetical protein
MDHRAALFILSKNMATRNRSQFLGHKIVGRTEEF